MIFGLWLEPSKSPLHLLESVDLGLEFSILGPISDELAHRAKGSFERRAVPLDRGASGPGEMPLHVQVRGQNIEVRPLEVLAAARTVRWASATDGVVKEVVAEALTDREFRVVRQHASGITFDETEQVRLASSQVIT